MLRKVLFILTMALTASTAGTAPSVMVQQLSALNVTEGGTAVMTCTYENSMQWPSKVHWTRNSVEPTPVNLEDPQYSGRLNLSTINHNMRGEAALSISDVRASDSDVYYCEVEVTDGNKTGFVMKGKGEGTKLRVLDNPTGNQNHEMLARSFAIRSTFVLFLVISGLIGCVYSAYVELPEEAES